MQKPDLFPSTAIPCCKTFLLKTFFTRIIVFHGLLLTLGFMYALPAAAQTKEYHPKPDKTATVNFLEMEKNTKFTAIEEKKKPENEAEAPGAFPMPPDAQIMMHNPPASKNDTAQFKIIKQKKKDSNETEPNFPGLGDNGRAIPPDIGAAAGPNHLMIALNTEVRIQNKTGVIISTVTLNNFFAPLGGAPQMFDPKILYDPFAQRWIITACANSRSASSSLMIGVSKTNNPTGQWQLYKFDVDVTNTTWFDYPSIGFNKNWIVVTGNMFTMADAFANVQIFMFDKANLYTTPVVPVVTAVMSEGFTICPAVIMDTFQQTEFLVSTWNQDRGVLRLYNIRGTPAAPIFTPTTLFPGATPWSSEAADNFAPQATVPVLIANGDHRIQNAVFRGGSIWCAHSIFLPAGNPTRSAVQWWQINPITGIVEQNEKIQDVSGNNFFAFPSLAVNKHNDMLIGYSSFSSQQFAGCNYSVRTRTDPLNTTRTSVEFKAGAAKYFKDGGTQTNRWGDYSSTCVDPDDCSIWTIQEYAALPAGGMDRWGTAWNLFTFPPTVSTFSPASGVVNSSITITGTRFNETPNKNIVFFGAVKALVTAATNTSLTVQVPAGATYQNISVTNLATNLTAFSAKPFNVTLAGNIAFGSKISFASGTSPASQTNGDLDGDGKPDMVVVNNGSNSVSLFRNTSTPGSVTFNRTDLVTGIKPKSAKIGDIDGNGKPDLVVTNSRDNTVSIFLNNSIPGTMSFAAKVDFSTGAIPNGINIGDIDGDGKPDLTVVNVGSQTVSVLRNISVSGTIGFDAKVDFSAGFSPQVVCIGDVDGDGKPDLAVNSYAGTTPFISIFRNTSTAGIIDFAARIDFATPSATSSQILGDVDGDGKLDLATVNYGYGINTSARCNSVSVFRNISIPGTISFTDKTDFPTNPGSVSIVTGDINGDGKPDLVVTNFAKKLVSVFRNTATPGIINSSSFATKADFNCNIDFNCQAPNSVNIVDIDGDGKPDLSMTSYNGNSASVIRQQ